MDRLADWKARIAALDVLLRPIAKRTFDLTDPNWFAKMQSGPRPLDEAGVRAEAEKLVSELIDYYPTGDDAARQAARSLFDTHTSFAWAAALPYAATTQESFRAHLILFSINDQERDSRDAILSLQSLCAKATSAGIKIGPILKEIAQLSSDVNRYGMGSTRSILLAQT